MTNKSKSFLKLTKKYSEAFPSAELLIKSDGELLEIVDVIYSGQENAIIIVAEE